MKTSPMTIIVPEGGIGELSDGYHTFNELYDHRIELLIALMLSHREISWKSWVHHDGTGFPGWFVAGMELTMGQVTYHLPERVWNLVKVKTLQRAPVWDGHTSKDVLVRIRHHFRLPPSLRKKPRSRGS